MQNITQTVHSRQAWEGGGKRHHHAGTMPVLRAAALWGASRVDAGYKSSCVPRRGRGVLKQLRMPPEIVNRSFCHLKITVTINKSTLKCHLNLSLQMARSYL